MNGRFVYDSSAYTTAKAIDPEYEESASYNPGIAALSVNFNVLQLKWERDKKGPLRFRFAAQTDNHELDVDYLKAEKVGARQHRPLRPHLSRRSQVTGLARGRSKRAEGNPRAREAAGFQRGLCVPESR